jgi:hypothetical protein
MGAVVFSTTTKLSTVIAKSHFLLRISIHFCFISAEDDMYDSKFTLFLIN